MEAALYSSRGLEALDGGSKSEAKQLFDKSISIDPSYRKQVVSLEGLGQ